MTENTTEIFVKNYALDMSIGVYEEEKKRKQRVIVNVTAQIENNPDWKKDDLKKTLDYVEICNAIRDIASEGHLELVETFAEKIAAFCLEKSTVKTVQVTVEKPDILRECESVGVSIERR